MTALLNWRVWAAIALAVGLAFSHFTAYRSGKATVRAEWNAEKLKQAEQLAAENARNAQITADLQKRKDDALLEANTRAIANKAAADKLAAVNRGLRDQLADQRGNLSGLARDSLERYTNASTDVFAECVRSYSELAETADRIDSERQTLIDAWPR